MPWFLHSQLWNTCPKSIVRRCFSISIVDFEQVFFRAKILHLFNSESQLAASNGDLPPSDTESTDEPETSDRLHPDVPSASEIPLPGGWAMGRAENGRVFFIDHNSRKTTWVYNCFLCFSSFWCVFSVVLIKVGTVTQRQI